MELGADNQTKQILNSNEKHGNNNQVKKSNHHIATQEKKNLPTEVMNY